MQSGKTPQVADYFSDLQTPNVEDMKIQLEQLVSQGTLSPEEAQTIMMNPSAMNDIKSDPNLQQAQMDALSELQNIGKSGGLNAQDRAKLGRIKSEEDTANRGKREAILQNAQARGIGGSGLELASQLQNQQDSAMRTSQRDMDVAALAEQRALEALMQSGQLAGNIQNQNFNQQSQVAQANDAISRFNSQNQQNQINQNVASRNAAQEANLLNKQNLANQNVGLKNQQQQYNKSLAQQDFQNQLAKRGGQSGVASTNAQIQGQNSQNQANATNQTIGLGAGLASGGLGYAAALEAQKKRQQGMANGGLVDGENTNMDSEPRMLMPGEMVVSKKDVPNMMQKMHTKEDGSFDVAGFLDMMTGHKYGYKKGK